MQIHQDPNLKFLLLFRLVAEPAGVPAAKAPLAGYVLSFILGGGVGGMKERRAFFPLAGRRIFTSTPTTTKGAMQTFRHSRSSTI